ncbi:iron complex outermembrane receptor protein [Haloferula luteola]|uniref:Iron complex outermembrane receptor protein n=1 Tax=Haloferula luteola TaxID=595692 RepID=A0A840V2R4_9BACT|nr:TonB-dependent siderophore receptor [Haloferula luteola]MBB5352587.1 iron complex outermembrane receptor protein [Haloferula luteola]
MKPSLRLPAHRPYPGFLRLHLMGLAGLATLFTLPAAHAAPSTADNRLDPLTVEADKKDDDYSVQTARTATRTDVPIQETPLSIQVVPKEIIEDQNATRLKDVYRNVSGVAPVKTEGRGIQFEDAYVRGFSQRLSIDGVQLYTMPTLNLAGIERVEVLKGPSSALYGAMEPGGMVNALAKTAEFNSRSSLYGEVGSFDSYRAGVDLGWTANDDIALRFIGDYHDSDTFRDFLDYRSILVAPSLTWKISDDTRLTTWMWYQNLDRPVDNGVAFSPMGYPVGPITRNLTGSRHHNQEIEDSVFSAQIDHEVNESFSVRARALVHHFRGENDAFRWSPGAGNNVNAYLDASIFGNWEYDFIADALWKFELGPTSHQVLAGFEFDRTDYTYQRLTSSRFPVSIFQPIEPAGPLVLTPGNFRQNVVTETWSGYLQDQIDAMDDRLHILVGGRVDWVDQYSRPFSTGIESWQEDTGLTGRGGVVYDLTPCLSVFGNASRSFNPNNAGSNIGIGGETIDPTTGIQYEVGTKYSAFEDRLSMTAAVYQITKDNVPVSDPYNPGFVVNGGELRSSGFEFDVLGKITPNLQLIGSYAYTDTEVLNSTSLPVGARFANIPLHSGSLWLKYDFTSGPLQGFGMGAGVFAASAKSGDNNGSFDLPGYARIDLAAWYRTELAHGQDLKFQVNVMNALDRTYYESSTSTASVQPGTPLAATARCTLTF